MCILEIMRYFLKVLFRYLAFFCVNTCMKIIAKENCLLIAPSKKNYIFIWSRDQLIAITVIVLNKRTKQEKRKNSPRVLDNVEKMNTEGKKLFPEKEIKNK